MKWTKNLPDKPGHYWLKTDRETRVCVIVKRDDAFRFCDIREGEFGTPLDLFNNTGYQWAGPIPLPE